VRVATVFLRDQKGTTDDMKTEDQLLAEREKRFNDVLALRKPDRVPVIPLITHYFPTKIKGISNKDAGYDCALRHQAVKEATLEFGWDLCPTSGVFSSRSFDALGITQTRWPGGALADDAPFQFVEGEYVRAEEYDEFLADPDGFTLTKIFPRIADNLAGLSQIPFPLHWVSSSYSLTRQGAALVGRPEMRRALESLLKAADVVEEEGAIVKAHVEEMTALGYPKVNGSGVIPAFDMVSDFFRGLKGSSLDIYRNPEKLEKVVALMQRVCIGTSMAGAEASGNPRVFIPMHRGADGFMSEEAFERFYWPTFKELVETLVKAGLTPIPLFEGNYTSRLKYLAELPPGKVAAHFDKVDRKKFKEICGDMMCFWGNVPASLMCTGTPQEVKDDVKELIDLFGDTGALIIDSDQGIPDESKPENVLALREAVDEYGVY
jgi:hypothetical protein